MWPPDPDPDLDPDPAGRSPPGAPVPGLRALLPARAFLCSLKGRLLLAESVSAAQRDPHRPADTPGGAPREAATTVHMRRADPSRSPPKLGKLAHVSDRLAQVPRVG